MAAEALVDEFAPECHSHVVLEVFVDLLELHALLPQFGLDVARPEYVLQVNPILLDYEPVVDDETGVKDQFLYLLGLQALSL